MGKFKNILKGKRSSSKTSTVSQTSVEQTELTEVVVEPVRPSVTAEPVIEEYNQSQNAGVEANNELAAENDELTEVVIEPNYEQDEPTSEEQDIPEMPICEISPTEEFMFTVTDSRKETLDILTIHNMHNRNIVFKVKTTTPEKYRVKPSTGIIVPGEVANINVYLQPHINNTSRDKFLVMVMEVADEIQSASNVASMWKLRPQEQRYMEHRLFCSVDLTALAPEEAGDNLQAVGAGEEVGAMIDAATSAKEISTLKKKVVDVQKECDNVADVMMKQQLEIEQHMSFMFRVMVAFSVIVLCIIVFFVCAYAYQVHNSDQLLKQLHNAAE